MSERQYLNTHILADLKDRGLSMLMSKKLVYGEYGRCANLSLGRPS